MWQSPKRVTIQKWVTIRWIFDNFSDVSSLCWFLDVVWSSSLKSYLFLLEMQICREEERQQDLPWHGSLPKWPKLWCWNTPNLGASIFLRPPCGWKVSKVWAVRGCIPRPQAGSWMGSEPPSIWDLCEFKARTLTTTLLYQASLAFSNYNTGRYLKIRCK